jgi:hypothetical protein
MGLFVQESSQTPARSDHIEDFRIAGLSERALTNGQNDGKLAVVLLFLVSSPHSMTLVERWQRCPWFALQHPMEKTGRFGTMSREFLLSESHVERGWYSYARGAFEMTWFAPR